MIEIDGLTRRFGPILAVDGVSFAVDRGEVLGFLGPNGAGKTTTMRMVTGFLPPSAGTARIGGFDVFAAPRQAKLRLGYLPEGAPLYPDMTAGALLDFVAEARGFAGAERRRRVGAMVDRLHLKRVLAQPIETLSKGFKRRVGLAQALLHDPEVLVLDEPTDGLDPNQKHEVRDLIREMAPNKAIVISTHILEEVETVCSRAIVIAGGRLVADGTPAELLARAPDHNAVWLAMPPADAAEARPILAALPGIRGVEAGKPGELLVLPAGGRPIMAEVTEAIRTHGWGVEQLRVQPGRLDDVFRAITAGEAPPHA